MWEFNDWFSFSSQHLLGVSWILLHLQQYIRFLRKYIYFLAICQELFWERSFSFNVTNKLQIRLWVLLGQWNPFPSPRKEAIRCHIILCGFFCCHILPICFVGKLNDSENLRNSHWKRKNKDRRKWQYHIMAQSCDFYFTISIIRLGLSTACLRILWTRQSLICMEHTVIFCANCYQLNFLLTQINGCVLGSLPHFVRIHFLRLRSWQFVGSACFQNVLMLTCI